MAKPEEKVAAVVAAAGGTLISRVRLQKTVYFLQQLGFPGGFQFEYHYFGPYSRELDAAVIDARTLGVVQEEIRHREGDGASYSIFVLAQHSSSKQETLGTLGKDRAVTLVRKFAETHVTVLELAATVHWLWRFEELKDWRAEIERRKPMKVRQPGRLDAALQLLRDLGLEPK
jgi:uncharacterized protein YwgA